MIQLRQTLLGVLLLMEELRPPLLRLLPKKLEKRLALVWDAEPVVAASSEKLLFSLDPLSSSSRWVTSSTIQWIAGLQCSTLFRFLFREGWRTLWNCCQLLRAHQTPWFPSSPVSRGLCPRIGSHGCSKSFGPSTWASSGQVPVWRYLALQCYSLATGKLFG